MTELSAQEIAERSAASMQARDKTTPAMGITLESIGPGSATMSMVVREDQLNGHGICHGGIIFTLADSAFAYACNSYNQTALAQHNVISYISPGQPGERLTATASEVSKTGRNGIYDVRVTGEDGRSIAEFRGFSRVIKGTHFDESKG